MPKTDSAAYERLIKKIRPTVLARCLGLRRQTINSWGRIVPNGYILQCSVLSGIPVEELRPELAKEMRKVRDKLVAGEI